MSLKWKVNEDMEFANAVITDLGLDDLACSRLIGAGIFSHEMCLRATPKHLHRYRVPYDVCRTILETTWSGLDLAREVFKACISNGFVSLYDDYCKHYDEELHELAAKMCRMHYYDHQESFKKKHIECEFDYMATLPYGSEE